MKNNGIANLFLGFILGAGFAFLLSFTNDAMGAVTVMFLYSISAFVVVLTIYGLLDDEL